VNNKCLTRVAAGRRTVWRVAAVSVTEGWTTHSEHTPVMHEVHQTELQERTHNILGAEVPDVHVPLSRAPVLVRQSCHQHGNTHCTTSCCVEHSVEPTANICFQHHNPESCHDWSQPEHAHVASRAQDSGPGQCSSDRDSPPYELSEQRSQSQQHYREVPEAACQLVAGHTSSHPLAGRL
jgi:hypothetical protein